MQQDVRVRADIAKSGLLKRKWMRSGQQMNRSALEMNGMRMLLNQGEDKRRSGRAGVGREGCPPGQSVCCVNIYVHEYGWDKNLRFCPAYQIHPLDTMMKCPSPRDTRCYRLTIDNLQRSTQARVKIA